MRPGLIKILAGSSNPEYQATIRISNSPRSSECTLKLRMVRDSLLLVEIQGEHNWFTVEITSRDLLVPALKNSSLHWLKVFIEKAVEGEMLVDFAYMTSEEIKISSIFLKKRVDLTSSVTERDSAAVLISVNYMLEGLPIAVILQVPKVINESWGDLILPQEVPKFTEIPSLFTENQTLLQQLYYFQQEGSSAQAKLQRTQADLLKLQLS